MKKTLALVLLLTTSFCVHAMEESLPELVKILEKKDIKVKDHKSQNSAKQASNELYKRMQEIEIKKAEKRKLREINKLMQELEADCLKQK